MRTQSRSWAGVTAGIPARRSWVVERLEPRTLLAAAPIAMHLPSDAVHVTVASGESATGQVVTDARPYVANYVGSIDDAGRSVVQAVKDTVLSGTFLMASAEVTLDRKFVTLDLNAHRERLVRMDEISVRTPAGVRNIELPVVVSDQANTVLTLSSGQTIEVARDGQTRLLVTAYVLPQANPSMTPRVEVTARFAGGAGLPVMSPSKTAELLVESGAIGMVQRDDLRESYVAGVNSPQDTAGKTIFQQPRIDMGTSGLSLSVQAVASADGRGATVILVPVQNQLLAMKRLPFATPLGPQVLQEPVQDVVQTHTTTVLSNGQRTLVAEANGSQIWVTANVIRVAGVADQVKLGVEFERVTGARGGAPQGASAGTGMSDLVSVLLFNGQRATVLGEQQSTYISDLNPVAPDASGRPLWEPTSGVAVSGSLLDVSAVASADGDAVTVSFRPQRANLLRTDKQWVRSAYGPGVIEEPTENLADVRTTVSLSLGQRTLLGEANGVGIWATAQIERVTAHGPQIRIAVEFDGSGPPNEGDSRGVSDRARVMLFNGQRATVHDANQSAYLSNVAIHRDAARSVALDPRVDVVESGVLLDVQATVDPDASGVTLTMRPQRSRLVEIAASPPIRTPFGDQYVQQPVVDLEETHTTVIVEVGRRTLVSEIGGTQLWVTAQTVRLAEALMVRVEIEFVAAGRGAGATHPAAAAVQASILSASGVEAYVSKVRQRGIITGYQESDDGTGGTTVEPQLDIAGAGELLRATATLAADRRSVAVDMLYEKSSVGDIRLEPVQTPLGRQFRQHWQSDEREVHKTATLGAGEALAVRLGDQPLLLRAEFPPLVGFGLFSTRVLLNG